MALEIPSIGSANSVADPKIKSSLETLSGLLSASNKVAGAGIETETIGNSNLKTEAKPFDWYTPKAIAAEETRENVAFGTLTTKDEITGVVVPENAIVVLAYSALVKSSVAAAGRAAFFVGANQLKEPTAGAPVLNEASTVGTAVNVMTASVNGIRAGNGTSFVTTGEGSSSDGKADGLCVVRRLAAGTYAFSVQFKATSGSVTAKERLLQIAVLGV